MRIAGALFAGNNSLFPFRIEKLIDDKKHIIPKGHILDYLCDVTQPGLYDTLTIEENGSYSVPFLGPVYPVILFAIFIYFLIRHGRQSYFFIPFLGLLLMFLMLLYASFSTSRFAFRYVTDFWPALLLIFLFFIIAVATTYGIRDNRLVRILVLFSLCWWIVDTFRLHINEQAAALITKEEVRSQEYLNVNYMEYNFQKIDRFWNDFDAPDFPASRNFSDPLTGMHHDRLYWDNEGRIMLITNLFIGVEPGAGNYYRLDLRTEGSFEKLPDVYINDRYFTMKRNGSNGFFIDFYLDYGRLITSNLLVTIKWGNATDDYDRKRLISVGLYRYSHFQTSCNSTKSL